MDLVTEAAATEQESREDELSSAAAALGETLISNILERQPIESVKLLVNSGAPIWYQNESEGISPLHAAVYTQNGELVQFLLEMGAIWNAVDHLNNTAGDIALSFNDAELYIAIRNAGVRAELLLNVLAKKRAHPVSAASALILRATDVSALGSTDAFLASKLRFKKVSRGQDICVLDVDGEEIGVMMGWEEGIMRATLQQLCRDHPRSQQLRVLNVGFGLGIIDGLFQSLPNKPVQHVIIEPHPDVLRFMKDNGWYEKPGVQILEGKWQDHIKSDRLLSQGGFDIVYTDTFSEDYAGLRAFFEHLPDLLASSDSRFSFFNGLGATNALFYDVYCIISELHLAEIGLSVRWSDVRVAEDLEEDRWGETHQYFSLPYYRLPIATML